MSDKNDGFKVIFTFLAGAAIGAAVGAVFATKPGKELRADIKKYADDLAENAKKGYDRVSEKAKDVSGQAKKYAEEAKSKFRKGGESEPTA